MMNKKQVLFGLRDYVKFLTHDELSEILEGDVESIEIKNNTYLIITFSNKRELYVMNNGSKFWYFNGNFHRGNNKPAVIRSNGYKEWWVHGVRIK